MDPRGLHVVIALLALLSGPNARSGASERKVLSSPGERIWQFLPESLWNDLNRSSAAGGDIDGDGFSDLVIGEPQFNNGSGQVSFFFGSASGLRKTADRTIPGTKGQSFGSVIHFLGDINGDGITDFFIASGEPQKVSKPTIFFGDRTRVFRSIVWPFDGVIESVGDLNGDGFVEVAMRENDNNETYVALFKGSRYGPEHAKWVVLRGEQANSSFGHLIISAGDVNGDGFADLLIAAPRFNGRYKAGGKAYLYYGSSEGVVTNWGWTAEYELPSQPGVDDVHEQLFSQTIASAGDVNGDGFSDVLIGAPFAERGDRNEGIAFLFFGSRQGLERKPAWIAEGNHPHTLFGDSVSSASDVNGDGFDDVLIGMPQASDGQQNEGAVAVYHGSKAGLSRMPDGILESDHTHENLGALVRSAGDVNGDGYADVLLVGPGYEQATSNGIARKGRVLIGYGSAEGLAFSHSWSLHKPVLLATQQYLEQYHRAFGSMVYWGPATFAFMVVTGGLLVIQRQLRRKIQILLKENQELVRSEERSRIARDIHDVVGTDVTQILLNAKGALSNGNLKNSPQLESILSSSRRALERIDELVWVTDPRHDSLKSLMSQMADFVSEFLGTAQITCNMDFPQDLSEIPVSAQWRHSVFAAVKEIVRNVVKHSEATEVSVVLKIAPSELRIIVQDNGKGFRGSYVSGGADGQQPLAKGTKVGRNGLENVASRIQRIGGSLNISGKNAGGTIVQISAPLAHNNTDQNDSRRDS